MKLLVTGGAGFIGANYVRWVLANTDHSVIVLDALTYAGNKDNLAGLEDDARMSFICGDVCDRNVVQDAMAGCDGVVHLAAESHVDRSIVGPDAFVRTNCDGTNVVCDVARQLEVDKLVHVSTDEVYGSITQGSFTEADRLAPSSPYSASKAGSDLIALAYKQTFGLPVVITRSTNNFGPYQHPEKLIPLFITNLLDGLTVPLYGDGRNVRDWCYVDDNCAAIHTVLTQGEPGEVYNVAGGKEITNLELTHRLLELCGADDARIVYVADRLGHDRRYSLNASKLAALGWRPRRAFDEALVATVDWYRQNRWWWVPLTEAVVEQELA
ncbi:MAG: dTDP-glucose 4,6-dehydratase [Acidimicrobiia bacterium]|nr:dTDP-glucose 4,6-dehydratase [Acidimicrobiia bacterium]MYC57337.1 dTDP-glucose 4,6-dehydratase [Acidimicrobiia bacterium]MYG94540.1 dTDP-glucose 4,6-dehydratase [Acidimicrobiia bacterium]MYI30281.1 dTDP-glucose 4,6-dehydratase [Acidimicrobiia bacterium]